jgi:hypothetical protein
MNATNSLHYQLCVEGAKWLRRRKHDYKKCESKPCHKGEFCRHCLSFKYVAVELNTYCTEQTDVWGYDGNVTAVIEVKTSHSDFLADKKKWWRGEESEKCGLQAGMLRWYLCPSGVINADELPSGWGLLYWDGKNIEHVVAPTPFENTLKSDMRILYSLLRREGFKEKIYNYRGTNTTIKPKVVLDVDEMKPLDSDKTESRNSIVCPYCGHIHYDYGENSLFYLDLEDFNNEECECEECNQTFFVTRKKIVVFRSSKKKLV